MTKVGSRKHPSKPKMPLPDVCYTCTVLTSLYLYTTTIYVYIVRYLNLQCQCKQNLIESQTNDCPQLSLCMHGMLLAVKERDPNTTHNMETQTPKSSHCKRPNKIIFLFILSLCFLERLLTCFLFFNCM